MLGVGDRVRLNKKFCIFKKSYLFGWIEEVFVIDRVTRGLVFIFRIIEWDGIFIKGIFYI